MIIFSISSTILRDFNDGQVTFAAETLAMALDLAVKKGRQDSVYTVIAVPVYCILLTVALYLQCHASCVTLLLL
jgi:hypothetical protein